MSEQEFSRDEIMRRYFLMYHQVGRFETMRAHRANYCDAGRFARQMRLLAYGGFNVVSPERARAGVAWKLFKHRPKPALEDWRRWCCSDAAVSPSCCGAAQ